MVYPMAWRSNLRRRCKNPASGNGPLTFSMQLVSMNAGSGFVLLEPTFGGGLFTAAGRLNLAPRLTSRWYPARARLRTPGNSLAQMRSNSSGSRSSSVNLRSNGMTIKRRCIPWDRSAREGMLLQSKTGTGLRTTKLNDGRYFNSAETSLASLIVFTMPSGDLAPAFTSIVHEQVFSKEATHNESILVEILDSLGMNELIAEQTDHGADENGLAVVTVPEQDDDAGDVAAGLNGVADELVPVAHHAFGLRSFTKDFAEGLGRIPDTRHPGHMPHAGSAGGRILAGGAVARRCRLPRSRVPRWSS